MYKDILLAVDREDESSWRLSLPVALAHCAAFGARLHLVTVVHEIGVGDVASFLPLDFESQRLEKTDQWLREIAAKNVPPGISVQLNVGQGKVHAEILRIAREVEADLIIMASHRPELADYLLGSNAANVVRHADCSVLVVRKARRS
jgi:nucleotide-binding universal stress UspA family protein